MRVTPRCDFGRRVEPCENIGDDISNTDYKRGTKFKLLVNENFCIKILNLTKKYFLK